MNYNDKLKLAKEALDSGSYDKETIEYIFPELKESEDEKTKRILHSISSKISFHLCDIFTEEEFQCFDAWSNAWIEKHGSQILANSAKTCKNEQNHTWSEEDELTIKALINLVDMYYEGCVDKSEKNRLLDWLKSLKDRYTWKPSDLQMECLSDAIKHYNSQGYTAPILKELLDALKKLKE